MMESRGTTQPDAGETPGQAPGAGQVHLWRVALDVDAATLAACRALLADDEVARAERFVFARERRRFTAARAALRLLLGRYAGVEPRALVFGYGRHGKPFLRSPAGGDPLFFNLSHSEELAVIGVAREGEIGVDIEYHRPVVDLRRLAAAVFCEAELAVLDALPGDAQLAAFYAGWTRKEAWIKTTGEGFTFPVRRLEVTIAPDAPARIMRADTLPGNSEDNESRAGTKQGAQEGAQENAQIAAFAPAPDFSGAVAMRCAWPIQPVLLHLTSDCIIF